MRLADERPEDEVTENILLRIMNRQCLVSLIVANMARLLYDARTIWIGGGALPWASLTAGQQAKYRAEVETLVKGAA